MKLRGALVSLALVLLAREASADQAGDARLAQALFDEGRALMEQKRFAEACPKLKESQRLDPGGGTLLNLASCHASEGKIATALDEYREALAMAIRDNRKDREQIARTNIAALEKDVPRVTVLVPHPVPGLEVKLDTTTLPSPAWGVATPVDPGAHVVTGSAPGYTSATAQVEVRAGERKAIELPRQEKADDKKAAAPPVATTTKPADPPPPPTKANPAFWTAVGIGTSALAVSVVTGVLTLTNTLDANDGCDEDRSFCSPGAGDSLSSARTFGWVSTISLGVAAVGLIVAVILPSRTSAIGVGGNGVGVRF